MQYADPPNTGALKQKGDGLQKQYSEVRLYQVINLQRLIVEQILHSTLFFTFGNKCTLSSQQSTEPAHFQS